MQNSSQNSICVFVSIFLILIVLQPVVFSHYSSVHAIPNILTYQGRVTDTLGIGITDTVNITFTLFNAQEEGSNLWQETHNNVIVTKGLFDVLLGSINPVDLSFDVDYWLEIEVDGDLLLPRVRLAASPYAFRAGIADSLEGGLGPIPDNHGKSVLWPEYPNAVFWRGTTTENKAIRATSSYDNTTGKTYYSIIKQTGGSAQNYHLVVIWHPPADYNYTNNDSTQFALYFNLTGASPSIDQVSLSRSNGTTTTVIGNAGLTSTTATLSNFTGLSEGEWVTIDISTSVNDGDEIKLFQIEIEYLK
ncbi:hypothetical protein JW877_02530 [bacterium]|nr:hypothetical protein [bacterium]